MKKSLSLSNVFHIFDGAAQGLFCLQQRIHHSRQFDAIAPGQSPGAKLQHPFIKIYKKRHHLYPFHLDVLLNCLKSFLMRHPTPPLARGSARPFRIFA